MHSLLELCPMQGLARWKAFYIVISKEKALPDANPDATLYHTRPSIIECLVKTRAFLQTRDTVRLITYRRPWSRQGPLGALVTAMLPLLSLGRPLFDLISIGRGACIKFLAGAKHATRVCLYKATRGPAYMRLCNTPPHGNTSRSLLSVDL
jgi:hypothetical protein